MNNRLTVCIALLVGAAAVAPAGAVPNTTLVRVPISPAAIAADPALANYQTWDLRAQIDPGFSWAETRLHAVLTRGSFYNPALGGNWPTPPTWGPFPHLRYDTFVTQAADPNNDATFRSPVFFGGYPNMFDPIEFSDTRIGVDWGFTQPMSGAGEFTVARLTFTNDAVGALDGIQIAITPGGGSQPQMPFAFTIPVPEPTSSGALLLGVVSLMRRRR